ncbi:hypothetical protein ACIO3O_13315 [Streptomyces sp. NPDC087440]|uniref:hypothetical protein n=1 Tax=Streptomyces sp. NPDC087440 TaxID=3365790 RepID=UPI003824A0DE
MSEQRDTAQQDAAETFPAVCGYTHLFPGVRCRLQGLPDAEAFVAGPWAVAVDLNFSDGTVADANLSVDGPVGPVVLRVPAHTTGAGHDIGERSWLVRELTRHGDEVELKLAALPAP